MKSAESGEMNVVAVVSMADTRGVRWQLGLPPEALMRRISTFLLINDGAFSLLTVEHIQGPLVDSQSTFGGRW